MHKCPRLLSVLFLFTCQSLVEPALAQSQKKSFKETVVDLKRSFHPDKAFILPFTDSTNEDLQAFLFSIRQTKGVNAAELKIKDGKAIILIDTKNNMVTIWNNLEKELRTRYMVAERTPNGFVLADSYQTNSETSVANNKIQKDDPKQNPTNIYKQIEEDAAKNDQTIDTSKERKSIWQQQIDYAEQMRQRDKDIANKAHGKNYNLPYSNPEGYPTTPPSEKGEWYVEYTVNGKKVSLYRASEKIFSRSATRALNQITCNIMVPKPHNNVDLSFTDPANFPEIRKFEFGKPPVFSKKVKSRLTDPIVNENAQVDFSLSFALTGPDLATYRLSGTTGAKRKYDNIESGYFEVLYFDSRGNGILEANFAFTVKGVKQSFGSKVTDLVITNGKIRIRLDNIK